MLVENLSLVLLLAVNVLADDKHELKLFRYETVADLRERISRHEGLGRVGPGEQRLHLKG